MKRILLSALSILGVSALSAQSFISEDFSSGVPGSWTQVTMASDGGWNGGTAASLSSQFFTYPEHGSFIGTNDDDCNCDKSGDSLFTETVSLSAATGDVFLLFDIFYLDGTYQGAQESFEILASSDGVSWSSVYTGTAPAAAEWKDKEVVDLTSFAGGDVQLAFVYNDDGGWVFGVGLDNVMIFEPNATDIDNQALWLPDAVVDGESTDITGLVFNNTNSTVTSMTVAYTVDGGSPVIGNITGLSIAPFSFGEYTHPTPWVPSNGSGSFTVGTAVTMVNGNMDEDMTNNTATASTLAATFVPDRAVLGEQATGTWCVWCPRGHVFMDYMEETFGDTWVGVAVHNADPMEVEAYDSWIGGQIGGYPSGLVGRNGGEYDPSEFPAEYENQIEDFGHANVYVNAKKDENDLITVDVSAKFAVSTSNHSYRLAAIVIENGVTGTGNDWAQANAYSGGGSGTMGGYEALPNPVPAADMVYDYIGRALLGGINGDNGSVPSSVAAGDSVTHTYTIGLDSDWDIAELHIAGVLIDNASGRALNVNDALVDYSTEIDGELVEIIDGDTFQYWDGTLVPFGLEETTIKDFAIYPNPAKDMVTLQGVTGITNVSVFDAQGRMVSYVSTENGVLNVSALGAGFYTMVIENQGKLANAKLTILK